jgi:hypothetical protein
MQQVAGVYKMLPPLLSTLHHHQMGSYRQCGWAL